MPHGRESKKGKEDPAQPKGSRSEEKQQHEVVRSQTKMNGNGPVEVLKRSIGERGKITATAVKTKN